jgi:hypothetical protein
MEVIRERPAYLQCHHGLVPGGVYFESECTACPQKTWNLELAGCVLLDAKLDTPLTVVPARRWDLEMSKLLSRDSALGR